MCRRSHYFGLRDFAEAMVVSRQTKAQHVGILQGLAWTEVGRDDEDAVLAAFLDRPGDPGPLWDQHVANITELEIGLSGISPASDEQRPGTGRRCVRIGVL